MYKTFIIDTAKYIIQFGGLGASFYALNKLIKMKKSGELPKKVYQTKEDRSCSTHIIGVQGSGKTYLAMELFLSDINKGYGALWLSTQGINNSSLLDYIPKHRVKDTILLRPYSNRPHGINLLKTYTNSDLEKSLIADNVVVLFKRLFENFGDNMEGILTASTLSLLEYANKTNTKVSLWELYKFLSDDSYRYTVTTYVDNQIAIDMLNEVFDSDKTNNPSLDALLRRMRKLLYHNQMVAFLSQKDDDIDLLEVVNKGQIIICDFLAGGVGSEGIGKQNSGFLAELIVSKFQLISETRNINSPLYPLYLDEFQTYTSTFDNIENFIDLNRQRRMPVTLINQRRHQLPKRLQDAADACGTKYILKLNTSDIGHYQSAYPNLKDKIPNFDIRDCLFDIRTYGKNFKYIARTPDIREKVNLEAIIERRNVGKYTVKEIVDSTNMDDVLYVDLGDLQ